MYIAWGIVVWSCYLKAMHKDGYRSTLKACYFREEIFPCQSKKFPTFSKCRKGTRLGAEMAVK